jgi:hypothetical protein
MTAALLTLALLAQPECAISRAQASRIARESLHWEKVRGLPPGLLGAVVLAESGGRDVVARGRGKGRRGCDVGPGQIHVPGCVPRLVKRFRDLKQNLARAARILSWSRRWCARRQTARCKRSPWHRYNPGSRTWWPTVRRIWRRIMSHGGSPGPVACRR